MAYETLQFYTYVTAALLDDMTAIIRSSNGSSTWRYLVTYKETTVFIFICNNYEYFFFHFDLFTDG